MDILCQIKLDSSLPSDVFKMDPKTCSLNCLSSHQQESQESLHAARAVQLGYVVLRGSL